MPVRWTRAGREKPGDCTAVCRVRQLASDWILCVDADVTVQPQLVRSLLHHAQRSGVQTFSVATGQQLSGNLEALIHPAMLTTLIYRFGSPGRATSNRHRVQANGQCFFAPRQILLRTEAFRAAQASLCEDITIVRRLAECGEQIGFYESNGLVDVKMYNSWRETWNNWPRSLPMRDQYFGWREAVALFGVLIVQALPLPAVILARAISITVADLSSCRILLDDPIGRPLRRCPCLPRSALGLLVFTARRSAGGFAHHSIRSAAPS